MYKFRAWSTVPAEPYAALVATPPGPPASPPGPPAFPPASSLPSGNYMLGVYLFAMFGDKFAYLVLQKLKKHNIFCNNQMSLKNDVQFLTKER